MTLLNLLVTEFAVKFMGERIEHRKSNAVPVPVRQKSLEDLADSTISAGFRQRGNAADTGRFGKAAVKPDIIGMNDHPAADRMAVSVEILRDFSKLLLGPWLIGFTVEGIDESSRHDPRKILLIFRGREFANIRNIHAWVLRQREEKSL